MTAPLVFAHRGSSYDLPEHTLAAYLRALDEGADGLECDVRLTRDGHLVCVHDRRLDRTSNGHGLVSARTLAELEALDFGSWHPAAAVSADAVRLDDSHTRLLTLARLLDAVRAAGRPVRLLIETKHPSRYRGDVERRLVDLLRRHGLAEPGPDEPVHVTVMSFSPLAVRRIRALAPALPTVLLLEMLPPWLPLGRLPFGCRIAGPGVDLVRARPHLVPALRAAGNSVYVWTVNEPEDLELVLAAEVDGVITDRPARALTRLGR
ncbi:glycerophosphodiester phosphodiesterase family protein [Micromonospora sp. WMMD1128]|uniref:glycerophosphodiester phosphodiesterase n=1 Tax=unclassified Micromonospora TaxID=2617518 RepID=UPI00248CEB83|nr:MULTISPECIES: glycerophosphodiester phosphodiesterase family protein [unclassified Micromonospora]WBB73767.1 glycerophosphodiester phosphodiesterase family protein [Micromonospora sp. WMMD1128]WFE32827.1 glycerophosphodiester phosphodiesterase family protein [Micromonospora sp. WMMD975]